MQYGGLAVAQVYANWANSGFPSMRVSRTGPPRAAMTARRAVHQAAVCFFVGPRWRVVALRCVGWTRAAGRVGGDALLGGGGGGTPGSPIACLLSARTWYIYFGHAGLERSAADAFYLSDPIMRTKVDDVFRYVFQTPIIETPVRGLMLQRYIIQRLETASGVTLRTCRYKSNHALGASLNILLVQRQMRKVEWNGNSVPQMTLSRSEDVLLVQLSPTYPGIDFLIWAAKSETLYLFQVTPVRRHSSNFWEEEEDLERLWTGKLNVKRFERV